MGVETVPGRVATAPGKAQGQRSLRHIHTALKTCLIFSLVDAWVERKEGTLSRMWT